MPSVGGLSGYGPGQTSSYLGGAGGSYDAAIQGLPSYFRDGPSTSAPRPIGMSGSMPSKMFSGEAGTQPAYGGSYATAMEHPNGINGTSSLIGASTVNGHSDMGGRDVRLSMDADIGRTSMFGADLRHDDVLQQGHGTSSHIGGGYDDPGHRSGSSRFQHGYSDAPVNYTPTYRDRGRQSDYGRVIQEPQTRAGGGGHQDYVDVMEAPRESRFEFPTAGSFVAEPFSNGLPPQRSYPSACPERVYRERSSSPMRYGPPPSGGYSNNPYMNGDGSYSPVVRGPSGPPGGYSYGRSVSPMYRGDTYSGGAVSYGPAPGRHFAYGASPTGTSASLSYNFPSTGSFVAEPFSPAGPRPNLLLPRVPSYGPPLGPCGGFGDGADGYSSPQFGQGFNPGQMLSFGAPNLFGGGFGGGFGSSSPFMPPPQGSFIASMGDPLPSFVAPAPGFGHRPSPLLLGRSSLLSEGNDKAPLIGSQDFRRNASPAPKKLDGSSQDQAGSRTGVTPTPTPSPSVTLAPRPKAKVVARRMGCC